MLARIALPSDDEELYPHEVPILLDYKIARNKIDMYLSRLINENAKRGENAHADT